MEKVLVEIFVPVVDATYDVFIPLTSQMAEVLELLKRAVTDLSDGRFMPNRETAICYRESGAIININMTVYDLGIRNGSKLMLI
jgi:hypothetical protein